ncbi:hypothetical protein HAX54_046618 [Datura stramonium]|uniref:Uncharacterized protein n=1 Tax=Datura stramonium TaxID=4076 RepID=A0ABS8WHB1_DATST|nr:hypothetical protein [Datura stramonium]
MAMLKLNHGLSFGMGKKFDFAIKGGGRILRFDGMIRDEKQGIRLGCCSGIENGRVITAGDTDYYYYTSSIASVDHSTAAESDIEGEEFVRMMREAQPYFLAHRGRTFVVVLSAEIIDSPFLSSILKNLGKVVS